MTTAKSRVSCIFRPQMHWHLSHTSHGISTLAQPRFILTCPSAETPLTDQSSLAHLVRDVSSITSKVISIYNPLSVSHPLANADQPPHAQFNVQTQGERGVRFTRGVWTRPAMSSASLAAARALPVRGWSITVKGQSKLLKCFYCLLSIFNKSLPHSLAFRAKKRPAVPVRCA